MGILSIIINQPVVHGWLAGWWFSLWAYVCPSTQVAVFNFGLTKWKPYQSGPWGLNSTYIEIMYITPVTVLYGHLEGKTPISLHLEHDLLRWPIMSSYTTMPIWAMKKSWLFRVYYKIVWGLQVTITRIPIKQPGWLMESKGPPFFCFDSWKTHMLDWLA